MALFSSRFAYSRISQDHHEAEQVGPSFRYSSILARRLLLLLLSCALALAAVTAIVHVFEYDVSGYVPDVSRYVQGVAFLPASGPIRDNDDLVSHAVLEVEWDRFAYVQYATTLAYLCNSLMLFARLDDLGCHANRLLMYNTDWSLEGDAEESRLLRLAKEQYGVHLQPVQLQTHSWSDPTWAESYTKLLAVNQTQYDRVLSLDSDSVVLQCLDELFLLPAAPFAMPRSYWTWGSHPELSDQLLLAEPNTKELERIMEAVRSADAHTFDMDIMNDLYLSSAMVLPHREYDLLSGEFRTVDGPKNHTDYLGNDYEEWNSHEVLARAKFLHFSDWPLPKPWLPISPLALSQTGPSCVTEDNCADRDLWYAFYGDFKRRRMDVCGFADWGGGVQSATLF